MELESASAADAGRGVFPIAAAAVAIAIFVFDSVTRVEVTAGVLYVAVVQMAVRFCRPRGVLIVALGCTALTLVSHALSPGEPWGSAALINRSFDVLAIGVTTVLVLKNQAAQTALQRAKLALLDAAAATKAEEKIRQIINTVPAFIWTAGPDGRLDFISQRWLDYAGMTLEENLAQPKGSQCHPDDAEHVLDKWRAAAAVGKPFEAEARVRGFDGEYRWFLTRACPLFDRSGDILRWYGNDIDIHDMKQAEEQVQASLEQKEALLREVHHRVKNNLQLISSLLSLQAARIEDPAVAELFAESRNRVRSMALVHENLYRAGDFARILMATHIQNLCVHLTHAYGMHSPRVELAIRIGDVQLDLDRAVSCSLIVNELVSNALKHAFPDGRAGRLCVELQPLGDQQHVLVVGDNGVGLPPELDPRRSDSLGLQLVDDLTQQLRGIVAVNRDGGTTFTITFDADRRGERER
jgi:PAS domain S-box-containing protein